MASLKICLWAVLVLCVGSAIGSRTLEPLGLPQGQSQVLSESVEEGCFFLRARWMDPTTGRFVSEDPYKGSAMSPTSLHRFLYANSGPVDGVDPSGRMTIGMQMAGMAGQSVLSGIWTTVARTALSITGRQVLKLVAAAGIGAIANVGVRALDQSNAEERAYAVAIENLDALRKRKPYVTVYRGVSIGRPEDGPDGPRMYAEALMGMAIPRGGNATPIEHNKDKKESMYTSWTFSRDVAVEYATYNGRLPGGVVLEDKVSTATLVPSPDFFEEDEVLRYGPVLGATPTDPMTRGLK